MSNIKPRKNQVYYNTNIVFYDTFEQIIKFYDKKILQVTTYPLDFEESGSKGSGVFVFNALQSCKIQLFNSGRVCFTAENFNEFLQAKMLLDNLAITAEGKVEWELDEKELKQLEHEMFNLMKFQLKLHTHLEEEKIQDMTREEIGKLTYVEKKLELVENLPMEHLRRYHLMLYSFSKTIGELEKIINQYWNTGELPRIEWNLSPTLITPYGNSQN